MSKRVFKYKLELVDSQIVEMPLWPLLLSVANQRESLVLYALVEENHPNVGKAVYVHGTGHVVESETATYIGTVQFAGGDLVFHVFFEQ